MASRGKYFGQMIRLNSRSTRGLRGPAAGCLTVETLEGRLCMDASGPSDGRYTVTPDAGGRLASLVVPPKMVASLPRASVSGPSDLVGRGADAAFTVTLSAPPGDGQTVSVAYQTVDGLARAGMQYVGTKGVLEFSGAETTKTIYVPTIPGSQNLNGKADRFALRLSSPSGVKIASSTATATIVPSVKGLGISCTNVVEGNAGTKTATFVVSLGRPASKPVKVDYATADGSATAGDNDYVATSGSLTFAPGETRKTITVAVAGDTTPEIDETFNVVLSNATNAALQQPVGVATIRTDDGVPEIIHAFQVSLDYSTTIYGPVPKPVRDAAEWAASRWSEVIVGDLPDVKDPDIGLIDDFRMTVGMGMLGSASGTDGTFGGLANATAVAVRSDGPRLPYLGITGVDPADAQNPQLRNILLHEFGHALGFGTLWIEKNLTLNAGPTNAGTNPVYIGANAVREYNVAFQTTLTAIPIENMTRGVAGKYGDGSYGGHWRESVMDNELMTSLSEYAGVQMPLSRITVAAMADLGYGVNYAAADAYKPPSQPSQSVVSAAAGIAYVPHAAAAQSTVGKPVATPAAAWSLLAERELAARTAAQEAANAVLHQQTTGSSYVRSGANAVRGMRMPAVFASWGQADLVTGSR